MTHFVCPHCGYREADLITAPQKACEHEWRQAHDRPLPREMFDLLNGALASAISPEAALKALGIRDAP